MSISFLQGWRTLADIYGDLASPNVDTATAPMEIARRLLDFDDNLDGLGMRTTLYRYQRRSIAAMIQKELDLRDTLDPLFISLRTIRGDTFYFQPGTMEVVREPPMVSPGRGGVLCEELGTGKTVMVLALVLATLHQLAGPEESIVDDRPVMTPVAFRHFPGTFSTARKRFHRRMQDHLRTVPQGAPSSEKRARLLEHLDMTPAGKLRRATMPFYFHYDEEPTNKQRSQRNQSNPGPRVMYLSSATLVVVPTNLLSQWDREIHKHCEDSLRVLVMNPGTPVPSIRSLTTDYDIILITYSRFTAEDSSKDVSKLHSWKPCPCPEFPGTKIPHCRCKSPNVSPFLQIRWKRLVIDEGHVSATLSTILVPFTKLLSVERRWIVTGTPTTNLLGLSLGKKTQAFQESPHDSDEEQEEIDIDADDDIQMDEPISTNTHTRIWNKYDREDLQKLGKMITHFVAVPQFAAEPKLIQTHLAEPLLDRQGPRPGAIQVLNQVMEMIMIRHRPRPFAVKSYNALQATIAINAIDSQRTDQDYMFHPRNADLLQLTVKNMSQYASPDDASVDDNHFNVDQLSKDAGETIQTAIARDMPQEDINLIRDAFKHIKFAANDPLWRSMQNHAEIPFRVYHINQGVFDAWTRTPGSENVFLPHQVGLMHADRLIKLRDTIFRHPTLLDIGMIQFAGQVASRDHALRAEHEKSLKKRPSKSGRRQEDLAPKASAIAMRASTLDSLKGMHRELHLSISLLENGDGNSPPKSVLSRTPGKHIRSLALAASSPIAQTRVGASTSNKLNYIINEITQYSPTEKLLIFSDSTLSLTYISEALELLQVNYLRFTTQVPARVREQMVLTFETSDTYRVFLMELRHGARGLNLVSASRVIFCEPVWQADRAHRIGQTRTINVKTLAIRGTAEENMVARRSLLQGSQDKLPKLIEEAGMRHYIANPKFLSHAPTLLSTVDFPLINIPEQVATSPQGTTTTPRSSAPKRVRVVDVEDEIDRQDTEDGLGMGKKKKKKNVCFEG
ncbi:SNF2 family N-terminal domain-containing protein [Infundibulicybe gibba]|nr:SNF2 family N-terminal domain-containing protein [Infundibulicybe gibba]